MTTSSNPLGNMKSEICGPLDADCALAPAVISAAVTAAVINRYSTDRPFYLYWWNYARRHMQTRTDRGSRDTLKISASLTRIGAIGVIVVGFRGSHAFAKAVGLIR